MKQIKKPLVRSAKTRISRPRVGMVILVVIAVVTLLTQLAFNIYIKRQLDRQHNDTIVHLILNAVDDLNRPAVVEPLSGQVYVPELKLVLPPYNEYVKQVQYASSQGDTISPAEAQFTTTQLMAASRAALLGAGQNAKNAKDHMVQSFEKVPTLQACSRGVQLTFGAVMRSPNEIDDYGTVTLRDGRTAHLFSEKACTEDMTSLVTYLKQIQSY